MDTQLRNKLIEIAFDRILIGALIGVSVLAGSIYLERYKLIEAQRVSDSSEFVRACADVWARAYDIEDGLNDLDRLKSDRWLFKGLKSPNEGALDAKINAQMKVNEQKFEDFRKFVLNRQYFLGQPMSTHFYKYAGILRMRADAQESARSDLSAEVRENSSLVVEELNKVLSGMRFQSVSAREFSLRRAP